MSAVFFFVIFLCRKLLAVAGFALGNAVAVIGVIVAFHNEIFVTALAFTHSNYLTSQFHKFIQNHGCNRMRFHDLRHSCASFLPQTSSAPSLFESLYLFLPKQKAGVETCGLFIFVGTQASISVPPWNLNLIRPSVWTVTVSMTVNQSFSSNSVRMSSSCISNTKAPMASAWASRAAFVDRSCSSCALTFPVI